MCQLTGVGMVTASANRPPRTSDGAPRGVRANDSGLSPGLGS